MEFKRLSEVTLVENATNVANVLIEEEGQIKRVPKTQVGGAGGGGGIATAIIKAQGLDDLLLNGNVESYNPEVFECTNMTFEEALAIIMSGNPLNAIGMILNSEELLQINTNATMTDGQTSINFLCSIEGMAVIVMWTADGNIIMQFPE